MWNTHSVTRRLESRWRVALWPLTTTDDAKDDFCDATECDAIDGGANANVHPSHSLNYLKAVAGAAILVILLLSAHHSMLLI